MAHVTKDEGKGGRLTVQIICIGAIGLHRPALLKAVPAYTFPPLSFSRTAVNCLSLLHNNDASYINEIIYLFERKLNRSQITFIHLLAAELVMTQNHFAA